MARKLLLIGLSCALAAIWLTVAAHAKAPPGRFAVNAAKGTVFDAMTDRTWQRVIATTGGNDGKGRFQLSLAQAYCKGLTTAGGGWRLPKLRELESLADRSEKSPAIDWAAFPDTPAEFFWSDTPFQPPSAKAWGVDFAFGASFEDAVSAPHRVRCVR